MSNDIADLYENMDYEVIKKGEDVYLSWLLKHPKGKFDSFLNNDFYMYSANNTPDPLHVDDCRKAIKKPSWSDKFQRSNLITKLANEITNHQDLFEAVETGSNRKPKSRDILDLVNHLLVAAQEAVQCPNKWTPKGVVGVIVEESHSPCLFQSLQLGPPLATGNSVLLCVTSSNWHSAFLLVELAKEIGFPDGILNVARDVPDYLINSLDMVVGSGVKPRGIFYSNFKWKCVSRPKVIVTETADLPSAAQGVIEVAFFNATLSPASGACVLVQESVFDSFWKELCFRFRKLNPCSTVWENRDFYISLSNPKDLEDRKNDLKSALEQGVEVVLPECCTLDEPPNYPVLIRGFGPGTSLMQEKQGSAGCLVICVQSFRHAKEAVTFANESPESDYASIWSERTSVLLEIARCLRASTIWLNTQAVLDIGHITFKTESDLFLLSPEREPQVNSRSSSSIEADIKYTL